VSTRGAEQGDGEEKEGLLLSEKHSTSLTAHKQETK
jgi:hypothetical protein